VEVTARGRVKRQRYRTAADNRRHKTEEMGELGGMAELRELAELKRRREGMAMERSRLGSRRANGQSSADGGAAKTELMAGRRDFGRRDWGRRRARGKVAVQLASLDRDVLG
jgi:hypothetical protein